MATGKFVFPEGHFGGGDDGVVIVEFFAREGLVEVDGLAFLRGGDAPGGDVGGVAHG